MARRKQPPTPDPVLIEYPQFRPEVRAMQRLAREMELARMEKHGWRTGPTLRPPAPPAPQIPKEAKTNPHKLKAALAAVAAVKATGRVPSDHNVALMAEKLGTKVARATVRNYRKRGLIDY